jgi:hypothetical protein
MMPAPPESVIVTGSRVISDAANSPTPLTVISTRQLRDTTPSNLADGLRNSYGDYLRQIAAAKSAQRGPQFTQRADLRRAA